VSEGSLLERVTAAAEERQLSLNTLAAFRRSWLEVIARAATEGASPSLPERGRGSSAPHRASSA
jgi:hypothetical protein